MTSKEWEKHTLKTDKKIKKRIEKYRDRSTRRMILGLIIAVMGFDYVNDVIKNFTAIADGNIQAAGEENLSLEVVAGAVKAGVQGTDSRLALVSLIVILLAGAAFIWAVTTRNKADAVERKMFRWMPSEAEIEDIKSRFDNDFVRDVLSKTSSKETESITVALEGILIDNNEGEESFNFNRAGFRRLTNYETKQLAFYLGSEAFPDGFIIHQLKKHATVYDNYARGYAEVGEVWEKGPDEEEITRKNLRWLLQELANLTGNKKLKPQDEPVRVEVVEGGHIVINKGYSENTEKYKEL